MYMCMYVCTYVSMYETVCLFVFVHHLYRDTRQRLCWPRDTACVKMTAKTFAPDHKKATEVEGCTTSTTSLKDASLCKLRRYATESVSPQFGEALNMAAAMSQQLG